jgi:hypothetical protein
MKNVINLTPHEITVFLPDGGTIVFPPSGTVARVEEHAAPYSQGLLTAGGVVPLWRKHYGKVTGLPPREEGTVYIVSAMVKAAVEDPDGVNYRAGLGDLYSPHGLVRDEAGRVIGCKGLA